MSNTFDKHSVLDSFIEEVNSYLPEIEANFERLAHSPGDMDALEETYRRTHTIGGSASMMDFPGLAHVAHGMEDILGDVLDGLNSLDPPTIGLLQRSLGRLRLLLNGIRNGVNEDAVIADDDADYAQYRASIESAVLANETELSNQMAMPSMPPSGQSAYPSLDEVLASFRTPARDAGEDVSWPEEPVPAPNNYYQDQSPMAQPLPVNNHAVVEPVQPTALEMLVATTRQSAPVNPPPVTPREPLNVEIQRAPSSALQALAGNQSTYLPTIESSAINNGVAIPGVIASMQSDLQSLEVQTSSLRQVLAQLRSSMEIIETQRIEFKGFLDGSKDALDRMEEWAGKAMGLNLRNSPEQVRRYLPLSVMWVANSKLKKVLDLLSPLTQGVEITDEQLQNAIRQLHISVDSCGVAFQQLQAGSPDRTFVNEDGWTPWEMQVSREAEALRERVTFERRGDLTALRAEIEAKVRDEIQKEYQSRAISLAARAELEQQIREEVRREFEARQAFQQRVGSLPNQESQQETEIRLRNELEIKIRQEFLEQIGQLTGGGNAVLPSASLVPPPTITRTSNFVEQAQLATGLNLNETPKSHTANELNISRPAHTPSTGMSTQPLMPAEFPNAAIPGPGRVVNPTTFGTDISDEAAEIFRLEADEHLQTISMHVAALEKSPTNRDLIQGIRRATHTLKGAAGMMGFRSIADLCHVSEDLLESIMEGSTTVSPAVLSLILDTAEILDLLINNSGMANQGADDIKVQTLRLRYRELLGEQNVSLVNNPEETLEVDIEAAEEDAASYTTSIDRKQSPETRTQPATQEDLSVRVRLQKLDELVTLFGELLVNRSVLEERIQRLVRLVSDVGVSSTRLRDVGQKLDSSFEAATLPSGRSVQILPGASGGNLNITPTRNSNGNSQLSHLEEFDELELDRYTEFHRLARGLSESVSDMTTLSTEMDTIIRECEGVFARENRLSTTFQDRLMKARLVPLSTMTPRLYRAARAVALKQNKEFEFLLEGQETEVDRTVYEEIAGPLLHLMRNAANHALETPEARVQKGKSPVGQIKLSASYEGNQVVITVSDDGVGIDPERIRNTALARGLIAPDQVLSHNDVIELIFQPGFSTATVLSEESGRGVGLDVVRDSVARLRGTIVVDSTPGQGTSFTMKFPTSLAIQSAMMVIVGGQQYAIPTVVVESIGRLDNFKRTTVRGRPAIIVQNQSYPLNFLASYMNLPVGALDERAPIMLVNAGGNRMALVIDEIKGKLDVVMKNLGPHLRNVHGIAGGTVLGNGRVILILELTELLSARGRLLGSAKAPSAVLARPEAAQVANGSGPTPVAINSSPSLRSPAGANAKPERGKHILVVDDSPSVRRVVGNMLKQNGWEIQQARDGVEALEMISNETPAAVLLDIEMPRMDGYELMATVRAQEQYRTLPMVVLTSRAAAKHQQRAMQLGASDYVVKPYQDEELLNKLNTLVYGTSTR